MLEQVSQSHGSAMADVRRKLAAMGASFNPDILAATRALYGPLVRKPAPGVQVKLDVAYGGDARQKLDVYRSAQAAERVLVYIPGGGFTGGNKSEGPFYGNIGHYFAGHGILTIVANYRLAPTHAWPAGAQDVAAIIAWTRANAPAFGAAARAIVLCGQSAGATHSAGYLFDRTFQPPEGAGVTAAILMSGPYLLTADMPANFKAYFGDDAATYAARSPLTHVANSKIPLLLSLAEYDPAILAAPTFEVARAVTLRDGKSPRLAYFAGHNHVSTVMSLGTDQDDVGTVLRDFIASA